MTPLGEICLIEPEAQAALLVMLDARKSLRGRVIACGPGRPLPDGSCVPMEVKVGDFVRVKQGQAIEAVLANQRTWIVRESDLLCVE